MDTRPIGVFDSGLGGLTAVRELQRELPHEHIVYFGDTGRVPYGTRSAETLLEYAGQDSRFLLRQDVKMIIAACGTVSSVAKEVLDELPVPALGVVEPTAKAAAKATKNGRIGVIATAATIRSGAFERALKELGDYEVFTQACPLFVSLVEAGWIDPDDTVTKQVAERYLQPLKEQSIDTLILGCTHFPLLSPIIDCVLGGKVTLVDAGRETARACADILAAQNALADRFENGECRFFVSDRPDGFACVAEMFLGRQVEDTVSRVPMAVLTEQEGAL